MEYEETAESPLGDRISAGRVHNSEFQNQFEEGVAMEAGIPGKERTRAGAKLTSTWLSGEAYTVYLSVYERRFYSVSTVTIRVSSKSRARIKRWASERGASVAEVVDTMVAQRGREEFLRDLNEDFRRSRDRNSSRKVQNDELKVWDSTLLDGLEGEGF